MKDVTIIRTDSGNGEQLEVTLDAACDALRDYYADQKLVRETLKLGVRLRNPFAFYERKKERS